MVFMPMLPGYKHKGGYNIPRTTKGKEVEHCLADVYVGCRKGTAREDPNMKRICSAVAHKRCG